MPSRHDLLPGTLGLLILRTLALEPMHGWAVARRIQQSSRATFQIPQGSLYPALYRLERQHLIRGDWRQSETGRPAKFYSLTAAGRRRLEKERAEWRRFRGAVDLVLEES
ncbi:MAG: PadR family transcriptional regulator [Terriglobales bacterium]